MVPGVVTFALLVLVSILGMVNTYSGLILPFLVTSRWCSPDAPVHERLPDELIEAARIDGAGEWKTSPG